MAGSSPAETDRASGKQFAAVEAVDCRAFNDRLPRILIAKPASRPRIKVRGQALAEYALTRSEMVVDTDLSAVHRQRAAHDTGRQLGCEVGLAIEAAIEILGLHRPATCEHPFHARARGPAGVNLAVADGHAGCAGADLVVREGKAAGAVKQNLIEGNADPAAHGADALDLVRHGDEAGGCGLADVGPCAVGFDAGDEHAGLPVVAERTAGEPALDRQRLCIGRTWRRHIGRVRSTRDGSQQKSYSNSFHLHSPAVKK